MIYQQKTPFSKAWGQILQCNKCVIARSDPKLLRRWISALLIFFLPAVGRASEAQLKEGNRLFRAGQYEEALKKYNDALIDSPESPILKFNAADASYQSGDFGGAEKRFADVADTTPVPVLKSGARYNQGNALYRQGKWKEAVEAYKESLRGNPQDQDAKYNLGIALNTLNNPPKAQSQPKSGSGKNDKNDKGSGSKKNAKSGDMSKQDADRLLAAAAANELKKKSQAPRAGAPKTDEDW